MLTESTANLAGVARRLTVSGLAAVCALLVAGQESAPADYKKVRLAEVTKVIPKLEELAAWCQSTNLFRERDRLHALVIALDSDHATARAALQYRKQPDGTWLRSPQWREAKNASEKPLAEYSKRRSEIADPVASSLIDALDREKTSMEPRIRDQWLAEIVELAPDSAKLRQALGEKRVGEKWVLEETASFYERRPEFMAYAALDKDSAKTLEDAKPDEFESKLALKWTATRQTSHLRLNTTIPPSQVDKALKHLEATWLLTHRLFGIEPDATQMTVVLLRSADEVKVYLATHPETPDGDRGLALRGYTLCQSKVAVIGDEIDSERLVAARIRVAGLSLAWGLGTDDRPAWTLEGFGGYVSFLMTGGFTPFFGAVNSGGPLGDQVAKALARPGANWLEVAADLIKQGKAPPLKALMSVGLWKMTPVDSLFATALIAYFIEGRPADAGPLIKAVSRNMAPDVALRETLAIDLDPLQKRFHRWIQEASVPAPKRK